jgi:hypothetical protein
MRASVATLSILLVCGDAAAETVSCMPARCVRREVLDPVAYQSLGRFLILGGCYAEWGAKDCYPERLDDAALALAPRPAGYVVSFAPGREAFVVDPGTAWLTQCPKMGSVATDEIRVTGAKFLLLKQHLASLPAFASLDIREIGFAEARSREARALFALYVGTERRNVFLQCFEDLDAAVAQAAETLAR